MLDDRRPTVAVDSLGCKLNQAEAQQLERQLEAAGYRLVAPEAGPDIYILNTCTVTHIADRKSRHLLRLARRRNPAVRLIVTGCYAERCPDVLEPIEGVELVLGNDLKDSLVERLKGPDLSDRSEELPHRGTRTRAFIKIQEGCRGNCAYCIVPLVRCRDASLPVANIVNNIKEREAAGCREVVLTGTEVGRYHSDGVDLKGLLERLLAETAVERIRLSSLQPIEVSKGLVGLWRDRRLCPHFHLSLQSGSDTILRRMKRCYTTSDYLKALMLIRQTLPEAAITTDVIVGFPGETDAEFRETLEFCRDAGFARVHVFTYSPRPGTAAASLAGQVPEQVKKARIKEMLALAGEAARDFHHRFLGRTMEVLWEKQSNGVWSGLTGNYIKVYTRGPDDLANHIIPVVLERVCRDGMWGTYPPPQVK